MANRTGAVTALLIGAGLVALGACGDVGEPRLSDCEQRWEDVANSPISKEYGPPEIGRTQWIANCEATH